MPPLNFAFAPGTLAYFLVFFSLGLAFGAVLELSGFGDSRRLAAQFYLRDMTVLKVMFTAIIVAAVLIHLASALHLLDLNRVWVNPTYLLPGIVGGLIMGVGFILGGFCPGTSLVAASTLKLDGVWFVLGALGGVFLFGETVRHFDGFWHSTFMGRFTLADWMGLPAGVTLVLLVLVALFMFYGAEVSENILGRGRSWREVGLFPRGRARALGAGGLILLALVVALRGQPDARDRWRWMAQEAVRQLQDRQVCVDPAEVVDLRRDLSLLVRILEVRSESDYNLFHLSGSRRISLEDAGDPALTRDLLAATDNTILFLVSNDEKAATEAWKLLRAQGVLNLYVIDGGINHWLDRYPLSTCVAQPLDGTQGRTEDSLRYRFLVAVGERSASAHPELARSEYVPDCGGSGAAFSAAGLSVSRGHGETEATAAGTYLRKVKLQRKVVAKGGCG